MADESSNPTLLRDIEILVGEGLYEEAEKRLMKYLSSYPRDAKAVAFLGRVERHLFVKSHYAVRLPTKGEALGELKRLAGIASQWEESEAEITEMAETIPKDSVIDAVVALGSLGLLPICEKLLNDWPATESGARDMAEAYGWMARFNMDDGLWMRARQWVERALPLLAQVPKDQAPENQLERELYFLYAQCFWEMGDRTHALAQLQELTKKYPKDAVIRKRLQALQRDV
jgi:tetratricopeptide (TPR) repeat protein